MFTMWLSLFHPDSLTGLVLESDGAKKGFPADLFTLLVPQNPLILEFYEAQKRRSMDFDALKL